MFAPRGYRNVDALQLRQRLIPSLEFNNEKGLGALDKGGTFPAVERKQDEG